EPGPLLGSLSESPMPIRSGAMQRPNGCRYGNTLRQRYDEVGLPCSSTMGSPSPTSTYAISWPRARRRCFLYGNAAEIMLPSVSLWDIAMFMRHSFQLEGPHSRRTEWDLSVCGSSGPRARYLVPRYANAQLHMGRDGMAKGGNAGRPWSM